MWVIAGQHSRGVHIEGQLAAELQIQSTRGGLHSLQDGLGLLLQIFLAVKTYGCHIVHVS